MASKKPAEEAVAEKATPAYVVVKQVNVHQPGEVVVIGEHEARKGHDVARLLALGAIREATDEEAADAVPLGTSKTRIPAPFPYIAPAIHTSGEAGPVEGEVHQEIDLTPVASLPAPGSDPAITETPAVIVES